MNTKNSPFKTLGIIPEFVRDMQYEQLCEYIRFAHRALQHIYHPDKNQGGTAKSHKKAVEINLAMQELENPKTFAMAKENYLKRRLTIPEQVSKMEKRLDEKDRKLKKVLENSWQFVNSGRRKMSLVPNQCLYVLLNPLSIMRLQPYNPKVEVYEVLERTFLKLFPDIFGFVNIKLSGNENEVSVMDVLRGKISVAKEFTTLSEEDFLKTRASFVCTDVAYGSELVLLEPRKREFFIVGTVMDLSENFEDIFKHYSERFLMKIHVSDRVSPNTRLDLAVDVAKKHGCKNDMDFSEFMGEVRQVIEDFRYQSPRKRKSATKNSVEKLALDKSRGYRYFSNDEVVKMATEYIDAGGSHNGLEALLKAIGSP